MSSSTYTVNNNIVKVEYGHDDTLGFFYKEFAVNIDAVDMPVAFRMGWKNQPKGKNPYNKETQSINFSLWEMGRYAEINEEPYCNRDTFLNGFTGKDLAEVLEELDKANCLIPSFHVECAKKEEPF